MKDRRLNSNGEIEEWERPRTIPDDFIYDPESDSYRAPGTPTTFNIDEWMRNFEKVMEEVRQEPPVPPEELKIAWAPNESRAPRRSRAPKPDARQRTLFSDLVDEGDARPDDQQGAGSDRADDDSADGGQ